MYSSVVSNLVNFILSNFLISITSHIFSHKIMRFSDEFKFRISLILFRSKDVLIFKNSPQTISLLTLSASSDLTWDKDLVIYDTDLINSTSLSNTELLLFCFPYIFAILRGSFQKLLIRFSKLLSLLAISRFESFFHERLQFCPFHRRFEPFHEGFSIFIKITY